MLDGQFFSAHLYNLISKAVCVLPGNVMDALEAAYEYETEPLARIQMETTVRHMRTSKEKMIPLCGNCSRTPSRKAFF